MRDANLEALRAYEDRQEKEEIHYESFCQAVVDEDVLSDYEDLIDTFNQIAIRYDIDMSLQDWLKENY